MRWRGGQVFVWWLNRGVREAFSEEEKLKLNCEKELALGRARGEYSRQIKQQYIKTKKEKKNRTDIRMPGGQQEGSRGE